MSENDRFRGVNWEDVLYRLMLRARHLFAAARAKGYGNALARSCVEPEELARDVYVAALENRSVKYKPGKGASITTFLCRVLEDDFKDLLRKGMRLNIRLSALDEHLQGDADPTNEQQVLHEPGDGGETSAVIHLRAVALDAARGDPELEDYVTAAFDCGALKRADQAQLLKVHPTVITNRRKRILKLLNPGSGDDAGGEK